MQKSVPQHDTWQVIFILSSSLAPSARLLQGGKKLLEHPPLATHPSPNHVVFWPEFSWDTSYLKCTQRASSIAQSTVVAFAVHSSYDLLLLHLLQNKLFAARETKAFKNWKMYQNEGKMKGKNGNHQLSISPSFTFANDFERFISVVLIFRFFCHFGQILTKMNWKTQLNLESGWNKNDSFCTENIYSYTSKSTGK